MLYCIVYHHNSDKVLSEKSTSSEAFSHENLFWHCFKLPHIEKWIVLHLIIGLYCTDGEIRIEIRNPLERLWLHFWHNLTDPEIQSHSNRYSAILHWHECMDVWMCLKGHEHIYTEKVSMTRLVNVYIRSHFFRKTKLCKKALSIMKSHHMIWY